MPVRVIYFNALADGAGRLVRLLLFFFVVSLSLTLRFYLSTDLVCLLYGACSRAANLNHGYWTVPYFDCNGKVKKWLITYASPFFGWDSLKDKLEFK